MAKKKQKDKKETAAKKIEKEVVEEIEEELEEDEEEEEVEAEEVEDEEEEKVEAEEVEETEEDEIDDDENISFDEMSIEDRLVNMEKKNNIILFLTLIICLLNVILLFGVFNNSNENNDYANDQDVSDTYSEEQTSNSYDTSAFKEITAADIESESKKNTIVVLIGRQGCGYCAAYAPIITEVAKEYNITIRYIDLAKIINFNVAQPYIEDEEAFETLTSLSGSGEWKTYASDNIGGTPLTLIIKKNKVIGGINQYVEADSIRSAFDAAGLKK